MNTPRRLLWNFVVMLVAAFLLRASGFGLWQATAIMVAIVLISKVFVGQGLR